MELTLYDTTLRDGAQMEGISFSLEDKIRIARKLDEFGIHYIEGGWPASNPKDLAFFKKMSEEPLKNAKLAAFGSTRKANRKPEDDTNLVMLVQMDTPTVTIFGKSWDFQVREVLKVSLEENLRMIDDSIRFLKSFNREVIFDAEHFFDGYKSDPAYAIECLLAAEEAGADIICLADTNGGSLPHEVGEITASVKEKIKKPLGIHAHNDSETAVANTIEAVRAGAVHIQGTINGYGERCGNANLCSIIPILVLKMGLEVIDKERLKHLVELSHFVAEIANIVPANNMPFVGRSAFAHKGGVHVDAIRKNPRSYEHIDPELVGNERRVLVSELSGSSTILYKTKRLDLDLTKDSKETRLILEKLVELENQGYHFEGAEASFELLVKKITGGYRKLFDLLGLRVIVEKRSEEEGFVTEATLKLSVNGQVTHTVAEGDGPIHALDNALRKALLQFYPELEKIRLTDFKVRVISGTEGTAAKVRVLVESFDGEEVWSTIGVSTNIIEASWQALVESIEYGLLKGGK
ncbi:citramalate synthase [bacterium]|nr:citramalate synthase [bacterium]